MAARKLQAEMDRTFKKIQEGIENFEDIEDKMNSAGTAAQKEKQEADLKTQIKKLQRLRDQLKTWQTASDIKDKAPIVEHRRLIEVQMEKFKVIEKEMKTKQYSTVGLISHSKMDPKEQQRLALTQWLQGKVEELQQQVETAEAELETLQAGAKKKGKAGEAGQARTELLELQNERRNWHISQLEIILRLVENTSLQVEDVEKVKEDVDFFVTMNTEEDFEYDDGVYAELNLENFVEPDLDESTIASDAENDDPPPPRAAPRKSLKTAEEEESRDEISSKKIAAPRPRARSSTKPTEALAASLPKPPLPTTNFAQQPMTTVVKGSGSAPRAPMPTLRYADAAALGTSTAVAHSSPATSAPAAIKDTPAPSGSATTTSPSSSFPAHAPSPPAITQSTAPPLTTNTTTGSQSKQTTPASEQVAPISPSERAASSVAPSAAASPIAMRQGDTASSVGAGGVNNGQLSLSESYRAPSAPSAPSVTSMSLASPEVSVAEVSASPHVVRAEASQPEQIPAHAAYTLQGFLPSATSSMSAPPGLALNGLREIGNASTLTVKPEASLATNTSTSRVAKPGEEQNVNNTSGPSGSPYIGTTGAASPNVSTNGHDDRGPQSTAQSQQPPKFAATLSDLMSSFRSVGLKGPDRMKDTEQVKEVLDTMSPSMPQARDAERPRYHVTRNPMQTPSYYPQQVLPLLSSPEFFERLDVETLFWVFYYMPGTYQQWMAAQELKKQAWRFHIKFLTWFQRHAKPDEVTDEYEQGQYLYFDWEGSWCVRRKSDFRFEYKNLSDD